MTDQAVRAVRTIARVSRLLECSLGGLSLSQYRILAAVDGGGERATHLASGLAVAKPTVTAAVDGLVERGFLAREPVPNDRRSVRIALTPAGQHALRQADAAMAERLSALLEDTLDGPAALAALDALGAALDATTVSPR